MKDVYTDWSKYLDNEYDEDEQMRRARERAVAEDQGQQLQKIEADARREYGKLSLSDRHTVHNALKTEIDAARDLVQFTTKMVRASALPDTIKNRGFDPDELKKATEELRESRRELEEFEKPRRDRGFDPDELKKATEEQRAPRRNPEYALELEEAAREDAKLRQLRQQCADAGAKVQDLHRQRRLRAEVEALNHLECRYRVLGRMLLAHKFAEPNNVAQFLTKGARWTTERIDFFALEIFTNDKSVREAWVRYVELCDEEDISNEFRYGDAESMRELYNRATERARNQKKR